MPAERVITNVYHWANGMTMVFDQYGEQMPEYQGYTVNMLPKLREAGWDVPVEAYAWRDLSEDDRKVRP